MSDLNIDIESSSSSDIHVPTAKLSTVDTHCNYCGIPIPRGKYFFHYPYITEVGGKNSYCVNCRVCPDGHFLNYAYDLTLNGEELYLLNEFCCDVCDQTKRVDGKLLRCPSCTFDICGNCEDKHYTFKESV